MIATFEPGVRAPEAERLLAAHGLTLGHFPQSYEYATLGGFAAARSSGQASAGYGRFDDMVAGLTVATPPAPWTWAGRPSPPPAPTCASSSSARRAPSASSPRSACGSAGCPPSACTKAGGSPGFQAGAAALRRPRPGRPAAHRAAPVRRDRDHDRTGPPGRHRRRRPGCLVITGYEGAPATWPSAAPPPPPSCPASAASRSAPSPARPGRAAASRAPYLRDSLLAAGATVETLETACFWSGLPRLYDAVRLALLGSLGSPLVMCHISHVYETGASLYFTVVTAQDADPLAQWERAKAAASEAIIEAGGTISHHHGVGRDHRDAYAAEIGPLGAAILRAVKHEVDPSGILNPGVLIP